MSLVSLLFSPADMQDRLRRASRSRRLASNMTQAALAETAGVPLPTLKRFEQKGEVSLTALLRIAQALDALDGFGALFPEPLAESLDDLDPPRKRQRAR